jgi:hypothetical protein
VRFVLFFVVGPSRTGSSLMARCIDDHPRAICLCESEINRALFGDYFLELHCDRMMSHGLPLREIIRHFDRKKQDDIASWLNWYADIGPPLALLYGKTYVTALGEKSPDFFVCPELVEHMAANYPLIYTVRDPRAILRSIEIQGDTTREHKDERWRSLVQNYSAWKPYLDQSNVLVVRYEDLLTDPLGVIQVIYLHLSLPDSTRFLEQFPRPFPQRFLWESVVAQDSGKSRDFDPSRIMSWKTDLNDEQLGLVYSNATVLEFMQRFGYAD